MNILIVLVVGIIVGWLASAVVGGGGGLLFDPASAADLASVLQQLIDDPALPARLAASAPVVKSIEQDAEEWDTRYNRVLAGSRAVTELVAEH